MDYRRAMFCGASMFVAMFLCLAVVACQSQDMIAMFVATCGVFMIGGFWVETLVVMCNHSTKTLNE